MEYIVDDCPLLKTLYIRGETGCRIEGTWVHLKHSLGQTLPLRTLVIINASLDQKYLEDFLRLTPDLSTLKLIGLVRMVFYDRMMSYDWSRLAQRQLRFLPLTSCHISITGETLLDAFTRDRAITMVPESTEWCLFPKEVTPSLLQEVTALPNVVTSLELLTPSLLNYHESACVFHEDVVTANLLHDYLCKSPHLVHLKAIRSSVFIHNLDVNDRAQYGGLDTYALDHLANHYKAPVHRPVWMCRGLRTLHMEIHGTNIYDSPVNSRIVFGFIVAQLETLRLASVNSPTHEPTVALKERDRQDPLQQIGLLSSVERMVAEMDREENRVIPLLQRLSFGYELGMPPEKALKYYFSRCT
ncbi:hypothetical protein BGX24_004058 [Mortierella sp. AD032]|nr:hypothetical protein BGX24_004058 [Mortierella sp. AD032]